MLNSPTIDSLTVEINDSWKFLGGGGERGLLGKKPA